MLIHLSNGLFSKDVEVLGLVALVNKNSEGLIEKKLGLSFYAFDNKFDDSLVYLKTNENGIKQGFTPKVLKHLLSCYVFSEKLHDFSFDDSGNLVISNSSLILNKEYRRSRRYIILKVDNKFCISSCSRLSELTRHYKLKSERNKTGLQWQNLSSSIDCVKYKHTAI